MRYRVIFEKRSRADGQQSAIDPTLQLDEETAADVVAEKVFVEWLESAAQHSQETLDEDDAFLGLASSEVWEYTIFDEKQSDFEDAVRRSGVVIELAVIDDTSTSIEDSDPAVLEEPRRIPSGHGDATESDVAPDLTAEGEPDEAETTADSDETLEGLTVVSEDDPVLGLTNSDDAEADWAADTGPSRAPGRGIQTRELTDKSSTLKQPRR